MHMKEVTCTAPVNIAVIKYWGKRDTDLILPHNSSLSVTLSQEEMASKTTIRASPAYKQDRLFLNGEEQDIQKNKRFRVVIQQARQLRKQQEQEHGLPEMGNWGLLIVSENNFPTAAGLASSASGFAALAFCLSRVFELTANLSEISKLARVGSGSACRSLFGGFVAWEKGQMEDGQDSLAVQVASEKHWPEMEALILVACADQKHTPSTAGMQSTVNTSALLQHRIQYSVPERMEAMKKAILSKNFDAFAELTMKDSNEFHAVCLDTFPPIAYLTDVSHQVVRLITAYNALTATPDSKFKAAYTFDAGPNAVLYVLKENVAEVLDVIAHFFPGSGVSSNLSPELSQALSQSFKIQRPGSITRIIHTRIGDGPKETSDSLIGVDGLPCQH